jgi:catechol 2,3-dioxygenase-like lactoylglutathione lyase family enzyme
MRRPYSGSRPSANWMARHYDSAMLDRIDHLVLTITDLDRTADFYTRGLGMTFQTSGSGRHALLFGRSKINLHVATDEPILPRADRPTAGSADFCLITDRRLDAVIAHLKGQNIVIELGPVNRSGAAGPIRSIYLRDPDQNLVEISEYI